jgi:hypothetical protein
MFDEEVRTLGGRRLSAVGGSVFATLFVGGGATGAQEELLLIGCFIQLEETEGESALRRRADSPCLGRIISFRTIASKPPSPLP